MRKLLFAILTITSLFLNSYNRYPTQSPPEPETPLPSEARIKTALSDSQNWNPDPIVEEVLQIFPLWQGSSWTYHYLGYDRSMEVVWQVVETVIDTYSQGGYYITKIERTVDLIEGQPPHDFLVRPKPGTFWYLIDGHNIYRFGDFFHMDLAGAWLDLVIPFPQFSHAWYPNPDQRSWREPGIYGFRTASHPFQKVLPMGGSYTCYNVATRFMDGTAEGTFCETIGYVYQEFNYYNRAFGYRSELIDYSPH